MKHNQKKMFPRIFNNKHISNNTLSLDRKSFKENFDENKLIFILNNQKEIKASINRNNARDEVNLLNFYKKSCNGVIDVKYYQSKPNLQGRYLAKDVLSGQGMLREVRHTIYNEHYVDLDICNCHPNFLLWICKHLDIETVYLKHYVNNRDECVNDIIAVNNITKDEIKTIFLSLNNGGLKDFNNLKNKTEFIINYKNEIANIIVSICKYFEEFYRIVKYLKYDKKKDYNLEGRTVSYILQYVENQVLMVIFNYLKTKINDNVYNSILCFDGIMIPKQHFEESFIADLEQMLADDGLKIQLKVKEMTPINLSQFGYSSDVKYQVNSLLKIQHEFVLLKSSFEEKHVCDYVSITNNPYKYRNKVIYKFNGNYWEHLLKYDVKQFFYNLYAELKVILDNDFKDDALYDEFVRKISKLEKSAFIKEVVSLLLEKCEVKDDIFDNNVDLIGFKNGVYDLKTNVFRQGRKEDYITKTTCYDYKESTSHEIQFAMDYITKIMPIEDEREFFLLVLSTVISGRVLDRFVICTGSGCNGKDALFTFLLEDILGDYYYRGNNTVLIQKSKSDLNVSVSNMNKQRLVVFSEPDKDDTIKTSQVKDLTGSHKTSARGIYSGDTKVNLHSSIFVLCNDKPLLNCVDDAMDRRLIIFKFRSLFKIKQYFEKNNLIEGENNMYERDEEVKSPEFIEMMRLPLFNLLVIYYNKWKDNKFLFPDAPKLLQDECDSYMSDSDMFISWFNTLYQNTGNKTDIVKLSELYIIFKQSELYENMTKADRRKFSFKKMTDDLEKSPLLRKFYRDRIKIGDKDYYKILTHHASIPLEFND